MENKLIKPLGRKAYGHIPHLPNSRIGSGDHHVSSGQALICTKPEKARKGDQIYVQEKLDGSCVSIAKVDGIIIPLGRSGYEAIKSTYEQHKLFAQWVFERQEIFDALLKEKERICGEWLAQACGTRYNLKHDPFVPFDIFTPDNTRFTLEDFYERIVFKNKSYRFILPHLVHQNHYGIPTEEAYKLINPEFHGAIDPVEGVIYRVENNNKVDFLAKWVRPDKKDGCYLPEISGKEAVWNWRP